MAVKADITIDIDKQVGNLQNLTNIYNARVGDNKTPLTVLWRKNGMALNLKGLHAFIAGKVGDGSYNSETDKVDFPVGTPVVKYEDDGSGTLDNGQSGLTTLLIPKQMWAKTGLFAGYIGLKDENGSVFTSKDIFFKVLGNVLDAGVAINYFIGDFDKALAKAEKELEDKSANFDQTTTQALQDLHDKYLAEAQKAEDTLGNTQTTIDANLASLKLISTTINSMQANIEANNIVTKPDFDKLSHQITNSLSQINATPEAFKNVDDLKEKYPKGKAGIFVTADTGHKWIYYDDSWNDCGAYQSAGLVYKNGLCNLVGFSLVDKRDIIYGNVFKEGNWTQDIYVKVPQQFYVYTLSTDGTGSWKYTLLKNDKTEYIIPEHCYLIADTDNMTLSIISDEKIQDLAKNLNFLMLAYNDKGNLKGQLVDYSTSQAENLANSWQQFVTADVVISTKQDYDLLVTLKSNHFSMYSPKKYQYSTFIVDTYTFSNVEKSVILPNYGILAIDLATNSLSVLNYNDIKNDTKNSYIVVGYNQYGTVEGMWSKYQEENHINRLVGELYPASDNQITLKTNNQNVTVSWSNANFIFTPTFESSWKSMSTMKVALKNTQNSVELQDSMFLIFDEENKVIEAHSQAELSGLTNVYIVLGFNSGGRFLGKWNDFSVKSISSDDSDYIPDYYHENDYIENKITKINENNKIANGVSFFWITDPHLKANAMQSPKLLRYLQEQTGINLTFCGGDIPVAYGTQADVEWAAKEFTSKFNHATDNFFTVRGNHDFTVKKSAEENIGFTESDAWTYNVLQRNNELKLHNVPGKEYWYVDNEVQKTRYIGLDTTPVSDTSNNTSWAVKFVPDTSQAAWLIDVLNNLPKNYRVITFSHLPLSSKLQYSDNCVQYLNQILIAFANHRKAEINVGTATVNVDFTRTTGKFIASFSGHTHLDEDGVDDGTLQINTYCDAMYNDDPNYKTSRTRNTINEQCFDVVSIDFDNNTVKCVRIGAGAKEERDYSIPEIKYQSDAQPTETNPAKPQSSDQKDVNNGNVENKDQ